VNSELNKTLADLGIKKACNLAGFSDDKKFKNKY
jgi:hypothetical protein